MPILSFASLVKDRCHTNFFMVVVFSTDIMGYFRRTLCSNCYIVAMLLSLIISDTFSEEAHIVFHFVLHNM